jgi:hypothetical protein
MPVISYSSYDIIYDIILEYLLVTHRYRFFHYPRGNMNWFHMWWQNELVPYVEEGRTNARNLLHRCILDAFQDSSQDLKIFVVYSARAVRIIWIRKLIFMITSIIGVYDRSSSESRAAGAMGSAIRAPMPASEGKGMHEMWAESQIYHI